MHELSIIQSILEKALKQADKTAAKRITGLHILMGELSKMSQGSIQASWDTIAKDTLAAGAKLHLRIIPAEFQCMACFQKYHPENAEDFECLNCGAVGVKIVAGEEFSLESIDTE